LAAALSLLIADKRAKVILVQSHKQPPAIVTEDWHSLNPPSVFIGRYGADQTVVNVLDDRLDRSKLNLSEYPANLLRVIDRHPLAAKLAADVLFMHGKSVLEDDRFHAELEDKLFAELWHRLVDRESAAAVEAASVLRIAVPQKTLESLSSPDAVASALRSSAIYSEPDRRWKELMAALKIFRRGSGELATTAVHRNISEGYLRLYKNDDDPKWIRESYFHRILSGDRLQPQLNRYYLKELIGSGHYCFRVRDFNKAFELYEAAWKLGQVPEEVQMRRASCLIRIGNRKDGEREFERLIKKFPLNGGMKQSFISALLWIGEAEDAKIQYDRFFLADDPDPLRRSLLGRIHFGLHDYPTAEGIFRSLVGAQPVPESWLFVQLARALIKQGGARDANAELDRALRLHADHPELLAVRAAALEKLGSDLDAESILEPLLQLHPDRIDAAITLARIYSKLPGGRHRLRGLIDRARKNSRAQDDLLLILEAQVLRGEDRPEAAASLLEKRRDEQSLELYMECIFELALAKGPSGGKQIASRALATPLHRLFIHDAQLLIARARVAVLASDRAEFDRLLARLHKSRLPASEVDALISFWDERHPL
jgi:predicted Zn-dependent protease